MMRAELERARARLEAAVAYAIDALDLIDAELSELEDNDGEADLGAA